MSLFERSSPAEGPRLVSDIRVNVSAEYSNGLRAVKSNFVKSIPCYPLETEVQDYVDVRNPQNTVQLLDDLSKFEGGYSCKTMRDLRNSDNVERRGSNERRMSNSEDSWKFCVDRVMAEMIIERGYDDLSDSESDFSFESDSDINFLDCSSSSDGSDHDSINLQSVRQWCKIDMKNIPHPPSSVPFRGNPGITVNIANNASILNYFELFFDDQILRMVVKETNRYSEQYIHKTVCKEGSRWKKWTETNIEELGLFFAVLLLQGVIKKPEQEHYWSKRQTLSTPIFAKVIGRNRFLLFMKFLHFNNDE
ncbi:piggyBac transposable element-derived protein 4 [Trichonephila clavipes]|nr:piggyBac transposable element-derived protein 4 [Trichonephila clavipes]